MTLFVEDLYSYLSTAATAASDRIYPNSLPQGATLPAVRYFKVSNPPEITQDGPSDLWHPRFQFDCYAKTYLEAAGLAWEIMRKLQGFKGQMGAAEVGASFVTDERDNFDPDTGRHWVSLDAVIWHRMAL
jgi:hypothetical protein